MYAMMNSTVEGALSAVPSPGSAPQGSACGLVMRAAVTMNTAIKAIVAPAKKQKPTAVRTAWIWDEIPSIVEHVAYNALALKHAARASANQSSGGER